MNPRIDGRLLFLGVSNKNDVLGYVVSPESSIATEVSQLTDIEETGVFKVITLVGSKIERNSKLLLLKELKRINDLEWINAKRLDSHGVVLPCKSSNCGGYTLEAELGITPNGYSEPDYLGWEIKQFNVSRFERMGSSIITLMTPEPTDGFYVKNGIESFIRQYGYIDKLGRESRLNFGGIHKYDQIQPTTQLKLVLEGYNAESGKITNSEGYLGLLDSNDNIAASWSFSSLLKKWNNKHANACYVPSLNRKISDDIFSQQYYYSNTIMLGTKTDFSLFLKQIANGSIYYDPGIKLELAIEGVRRQNIKRRSQFRIKSSNLTHLYEQNEIIDLHSLK